MNYRKAQILNWEAQNIQRWLNEYTATSSGRARRAHVGTSGEYIVVEALPLPDGYRPDELDVVLLLDNYPAMPPIGVYMLTRGNEALVKQIASHFYAYRDRAFHDAVALPGYTWACYHYADNRMHYNAAAPQRGDNVQKFLAAFCAELA